MGDKSPKDKNKKQSQREQAVQKDKRKQSARQASFDHTPAKSK